MKVRKRLTALYTGVFAALYLLFTIGTYELFTYHLGAEIDGALASWSLKILDSDGSGRVMIPGQSEFRLEAADRHYEMPDAFVRAFGSDGELIVDRSSFSDKGGEVLRAAVDGLLGAPGQSFETLRIEGQRYRILVKKIVDSSGAGATLVLGRSLIHVEKSVDGLVASLAIAWLIAVSLGSSVMWILVGQTIRPVNSMTTLALSIAQSSDLKGRITVGGEQDEFSELARALNRMLAAIEVTHEAQKQFLADASHQLRTPLTSIRANLGFIAAATGAPRADKEAALLESLAEAERMTLLVSQLLLLARTEAPIARELAPVELGELLSSIRQGLGESLGGSLDLRLHKGPLKVLGVREELRQAILMLLENSRKYAGPEGRIQVTTRREGGSALILVEDEGPGVPPGELPLVFERFFRASTVRDRLPGSGLGLAIVKSIVQRHDGAVAVANRQPRGFSVKLLLPLLPSS